VLTSPDYTESGKARRKAELQKELRQRLTAEDEHLAGYDRHLDQLKRSTKPKDRGSEIGDVLRYLQLSEIRGELRGMDPLLLKAEYESRSADTSGRYDLWLEAVETAPGTPLLPGETIDRGQASRALRALDPAIRQQIADLEALKSAHEHFLTLIKRGDLPADDPIAAIASGEVDVSDTGR
jgi:hypothetical protein